MKGSIYIIRNTINDKIYYGQTKRKLKIRLREHKSRANTKSKDYLLYEEMNKIGINNFYIELVEEVDHGELEKIESKYIRSYIDKTKLLNVRYGLSYELISRIIVLYKKGNTIKNISAKYHMCKKTVSKLLKENNVVITDWNEKQKIKFDLEEVKNMYYQKNMTADEIAKKYNTSDVTVAKYMRKNNLELRPAINRKYL